MINKIVAAYKPYFPALLTTAGGVLVAAALFIGDGDDQKQRTRIQVMRLVGAVMAASGAFWSGHRQIKSGAENKIRNEKLLDLSEKLRCSMTGGDGFCYGYPMMTNSGQFQWNFIHSGEFPLYDVQVRIHDMRKPIATSSSTLNLGTLFPGRAHFYGNLPGAIEIRTPAQSFNLFFVARNGSWTQEIRWVEKPGVLAVANRVLRDGRSISEPVLYEVSPEYPGDTPSKDAWTSPPDLVKFY
jgi:hypothetical protein